MTSIFSKETHGRCTLNKQNVIKVVIWRKLIVFQKEGPAGERFSGGQGKKVWEGVCWASPAVPRRATKEGFLRGENASAAQGGVAEPVLAPPATAPHPVFFSFSVSQ